ncbi:hypothetical protein BHF70_00985 [Anaerostipes sp. 494a]|uniref:hypothetical protein n=1 Tax=Anaerostipes TaxID=207244 RepID=UPI000950BA62|nr:MULTISPECIES: hypothetical protein [Anaerostipes]OLR58320.1 hypothetical protein BHF70_00985 [Anaerostipes sp. 494a]
MLHIKGNYYIQIKKETYILLVKTYDAELHRNIYEIIGKYSSMKAAFDAVIKEMVKKEVRQQDPVSLHEIVHIMRRKYKELYGQIGRCRMNYI